MIERCAMSARFRNRAALANANRDRGKHADKHTQPNGAERRGLLHDVEPRDDSTVIECEI